MCVNHAGVTGGGGRTYTDSVERVQRASMPYVIVVTWMLGHLFIALASMLQLLHMAY